MVHDEFHLLFDEQNVIIFVCHFFRNVLFKFA